MRARARTMLRECCTAAVASERAGGQRTFFANVSASVAERVELFERTVVVGSGEQEGGRAALIQQQNYYSTAA